MVTTKKTVPKKKTAKETDSTLIGVRLQNAKLAALDSLSLEAGINRSALIQLAVERLLKQGL